MRIDGRPNPDDVHSTRGGRGFEPRREVDTHEEYDCVIVGAGASGLAAAKYYRDRFGDDSRILLLEAMDDYGGHSARNRFEVPSASGQVSLIRNAGTVNLDSVGTWNQTTGGLMDLPGTYGQPALDLLEFCGVDINAFPDNVTSSIPSSFGLRPMLLFPSLDWGTDTLARNRNEPNTAAGWTAFVNRLPYSQAAKEAIVRIQTDDSTDWIAAKHGSLTETERRDLITRITYKQYLMDYLGAPEEAVVQYQRTSHALLGAGVQAVSAVDMWLLGQPGFDGALLGDPVDAAFPGVGRTPQMGAKAVIDPTLFWPDGNATAPAAQQTRTCRRRRRQR
jgi:spermidine dehydrogenase